MRWGRLRVFGSALAGGALLVACADALGPSISAIDDLFRELDATWMSSTNPVSVSPGVTHLTTRPAAGSCDYSASSERFVCPSRTQNGITSSTSYQLLDAADAPQASLSDAIAAVRFVTDVSGVLASAGTTATTAVTAHSDAVVSGLHSGIHVLNSAESSTFAFSDGQTTITYSMVETTSNLVLADRANDNPYPPSGSITTRIFAGAPGPESAALSTVTSTFNGTQKVTLVISSGGVTQTCTIDLKGAAAVCN